MRRANKTARPLALLGPRALRCLVEDPSLIPPSATGLDYVDTSDLPMLADHGARVSPDPHLETDAAGSLISASLPTACRVESVVPSWLECPAQASHLPVRAVGGRCHERVVAKRAVIPPGPRPPACLRAPTGAGRRTDPGPCHPGREGHQPLVASGSGMGFMGSLAECMHADTEGAERCIGQGRKRKRAR